MEHHQSHDVGGEMEDEVGKDTSKDLTTPSSSEPKIENSNTIVTFTQVTEHNPDAAVDICRICHGEGDPSHPLIQPCLCAGSLRFVHHPCLQKWILESSTRSCELCRFQFIMSSESKPFNKWKRLDLTSMERRRVICSVSFHIIALVCVVWSLSVLLERTAEEVSKKKYGWAFWTKLVVVTVGFTGGNDLYLFFKRFSITSITGVIFMYVQCKMYIRLCRRWRTYNRIIYIQDRRPPTQRFCEGTINSEDNHIRIVQVVTPENIEVGNIQAKQNNSAAVYTVSD